MLCYDALIFANIHLKKVEKQPIFVECSYCPRHYAFLASLILTGVSGKKMIWTHVSDLSLFFFPPPNTLLGQLSN